jgi:hypothetical protein
MCLHTTARRTGEQTYICVCIQRLGEQENRLIFVSAHSSSENRKTDLHLCLHTTARRTGEQIYICVCIQHLGEQSRFTSCPHTTTRRTVEQISMNSEDYGRRNLKAYTRSCSQLERSFSATGQMFIGAKAVS